MRVPGDPGPLNTALRAAEHYRATIGEALQRPERDYPGTLATLEDALPESGLPGSEVIAALIAGATPGLHATTGPRFFGWVIGGSDPVGVAADWLTSAWGQNAGNHTASPAAAAFEAVAARWLLALLALPAESSVGFVTGATVANFVALSAARGEVLRRAGWDSAEDGLSGAPPLRVLLGADAHSTVLSSLQYLGIGRRQLVRLPTDAQGRILPEALAPALSDSDGPTILITQAGQLNTGAFDPHEALITEARAHPNCWIHVDGAFGLWARACPERAAPAAGIELADSWATDGHKWLQTPYDCGYAIVRNAEAHRRAMTIAASYLPGVAEGERDPSHYVPELSRRARGFATWAMIRHLGREGIAEMVARHCAQATLFATLLAQEPGVFVLNDVVLNQAVVRFGDEGRGEDGDAATRAVIDRIQADGTCFAGGAQWKGRWVMRLSVINRSTTDADIRTSAEAILRAWRQVRARPSAR